MLISIPEIVQKYDLQIKGVIVGGAHWAEEHDMFRGLGIFDIVYVEPCKASYNKMVIDIFRKENAEGEPHFDLTEDTFRCKIRDIILYNCALGDKKCEMEMFASPDNQGQSNSLLNPMLHLSQHPEVRFTEKEMVKVFPLDSLRIDKTKYNMLYLDVQGAEGLVLKGATETLKNIDIIYTEVNRGQTYEGNMEIDEMVEFLLQYGFELKETYWPSRSWTWGDSVFIKNHSIHRY